MIGPFVSTLQTSRQVGRLNRRTYLVALFLLSLATSALPLILNLVLGLEPEQGGMVAQVLLVPVTTLLLAGRLNDLGVNGWWALLERLAFLPALLGWDVAPGLIAAYVLLRVLVCLLPGKGARAATA